VTPRVSPAWWWCSSRGVALDEDNRLSEDDQPILASITADPPQRVKIIVAWSNATAPARAAIELLIRELPQDPMDAWANSTPTTKEKQNCAHT
jgi:hypothetical protein